MDVLNTDNGMIGFSIISSKIGFSGDELMAKNIDRNVSVIKEIVWDSGRFVEPLSLMHYNKYGNDIQLILVFFHILSPYDNRSPVKEIGYYRRKEKSIALNIVLPEAFFDIVDTNDKYIYLKNKLTERLGLLKNTIHRNKLDTKFDLLLTDITAVL